MSVFDRLNYNFDSGRFGEASTLTSGASNTLNLIADTTPTFKDWQKTDLASGASGNRSNYFQNRTTVYNTSMLVSANTIAYSANLANDSVTFTSASNLTIELNVFQSHTDNISGVATVTDYRAPSYDSLSTAGQQNMMTLTKTDGPQSNTVPILGGFSSLFIQDTLSASANQLAIYANTYSQSLTANTVTDPDTMLTSTTYSSNLTSGQINDIVTYMNNVNSTLATRVSADWTFYQNSITIAKEGALLQQFNSAGATNSYLLNNVVGTPSLVAKLNS